MLNTDVFANIDQALGGPFTVSVAGSADYTLSATNALNLYHAPTGILTGSISYIFPASSGRIVIVNNATTGSFSLTVKTAGGTGVIVPQGSIAWVFMNSSGNVASVPFGVTTSVTLASGTTTDLGSTGSNKVTVSGTTTITSLGSSANTITPIYFVKFSGALTLTHSGTALILPGSANITTAANDYAIFEYLGSGNWVCANYKKADGTAVIASATNPFSDASALVKNSSDATKLALFSAASITTGTTRTYTLPNKNGTVAMTSDITSAAVRRQLFAAGGTYTPDANLLYCLIEAWAGGGGGGGVTNVAGAAAGGGGAGGYVSKVVAVATIGASQTVTIGAAGAAGANTGGTGGTGGTTSVGAIVSATGGVGGSGATGGGSTLGGAGGVGSSGDVNATGAPGGFGLANGTAIDVSGGGAATSLGGAGRSVRASANGANAVANSGAGGSGAYSLTGGAFTGGVGGTGYVAITEYCSQ